MMLCLVGVLLSCGALCLTTPVPLPTPLPTKMGCTASYLILETLVDVQKLKSEGSSKITPRNNKIEAGGKVTTYLEGFIEALKLSEESSKERLIAQNLQKIQDAIKSCTGWMEQDLEPMKEDFFSKLEYLLRFLNHNTLPKETA